MHVLYAPFFPAEKNLSKEESRHLIKVLRAKTGDLVQVTNGKGGLFVCEIENADDKKCSLGIVSQKETNQALPEIALAIAPTKNMARLEWAIEKCVEMGVTKIFPIWCAHSERKVLKIERLQKIVVAAGKQSIKANFPDIAAPMKMKGLLEMRAYDHTLIAHCAEGKKDFISKTKMNGSILVLIGPEGDFSDTEIEMGLEFGCKPVHLGTERLRTETAAVFAVSALFSQFYQSET